MAFYSVYDPVNFSVVPELRSQPAAISRLVQFPELIDLGGDSGSLRTNQMLCGSLYFNPNAGNVNWELPSGENMLKAFGEGLDRYVGSGAIIRLEIVNYGANNVTIDAGVGGANSKTFAGGAGTGFCDCLNIKFTTSTGTYVVF